MTAAPPPADVAVVGGGPAAWAVAAACGRAGLAVTLVTPSAAPAWPANYAAWADELDLDDLGPAVVRRGWPAVRVVAGPTGERTLRRPYVLLDNAALAAALTSRFAHHGGRIVVGAAAGAAPTPGGATVVTRAGEVVDATVVIDASGWPPALVRAPDPPAWQVAHGVVVAEPRRRAVDDPATCVLMDWTPVAGEPDPQPSFLYAVDLGDGRTLYEETVLAAARPLAPAVLARRLERRLAARGTPLGEVLTTETVRIPMGLGAPAPQAVVGFGVAGGLVHPATGYSVAAALRLAPRVAVAVAAAQRRGAVPGAVAAAAWDAVWPADRRRARALERFGFDAVLRMDQVALGSFFDAFFALPGDAWAGYLSGTLPAAEVAALMARLFRRAPWPLRRRLAAGDPRSLLRARRR